MSEKTAALIEKAYAAALDDTLWEEWAKDLTVAMNCVCGMFFVIGIGDQPIERLSPFWRAIEMVDEYQDHWWQFDPQLKLVTPAQQSLIYRSQDHVNENDASVASYCDWQRARGRFDHHIGVVAMLGNDGRKGGVVFHRSVDAGPVTPKGEGELNTMLPEIIRAFRLGFQHQQMLSNSFWDGLAAQSAGEAMLLIDERGTVMRATDVAISIFKRNDGLSVTRERLRAQIPAEDATLLSVIGRAIAMISPMSGATRICRRSGKPSYIVIAYPLVRRSRMLAPLEAAALVRIVDPTSRMTGSPALLREAFGFTSREAELALLLLAEHSVETAAMVMGIALPTARIHLRQLLSKTGTSRQAECIGLLARLS